MVNSINSHLLFPSHDISDEELLDNKFISDEFYEEKKEQKKPLPKKAYLAMSNLTGLQKLYSLWRRYAEVGEVPEGYTPLINALSS